MWSWRRDQLLDPTPDHGQLLAGTEPVDAAGAHPRRDLVLQRRDPDLVELVEQLREDGEELHPLEQRLAVVLGQVEQTGAEVEPRLLAVGEALVPEGLDLLVRGWDRAFDGGRLRGHRDRHLGLARGRGLRLGLLAAGSGSWVRGFSVGRPRRMPPSILPLTSTIRPVPSRTRRTPLPRYVWGPKPKRRTEFGLLLFGSLLIVALYVIAELGVKSKIPANIGPFLGDRLGAGARRPHGEPMAGPRRQRGHPAPGRAAERDRLRRHRSLEPALRTPAGRLGRAGRAALRPDPPGGPLLPRPGALPLPVVAAGRHPPGGPPLLQPRSTGPGCGCTSVRCASSRSSSPRSCCASSSPRTSPRTRRCSPSRRPGSGTGSSSTRARWSPCSWPGAPPWRSSGSRGTSASPRSSSSSSSACSGSPPGAWATSCSAWCSSAWAPTSPPATSARSTAGSTSGSTRGRPRPTSTRGAPSCASAGTASAPGGSGAPGSGSTSRPGTSRSSPPT